MSSRKKKKVRKPAASPAKRSSGKPGVIAAASRAAALDDENFDFDLGFDPGPWNKVEDLARDIGFAALADIVKRIGDIYNPAPNPDHLIKSWREFTAAYRTPVAAAKAAAAGKDVSVFCDGERIYSFEMVAAPQGPQARHTAWTAQAPSPGRHRGAER